ncbi:hypothetical protein, partial [Acinetobacter junii]|uniref:hypothetical protein n=1 Tax=Acinetobacter junii TaxID=40215 RepID=UPI00124FB717
AELKSQLRTLKRQSEAAIQYKTLETQIRTLKIEILSFQANQSFVDVYFYTKTEITSANRAEIEAEPWYLPELEYTEASLIFIDA